MVSASIVNERRRMRIRARIKTCGCEWGSRGVFGRVGGVFAVGSFIELKRRRQCPNGGETSWGIKRAGAQHRPPAATAVL
jgi:hypothetical protein